MYTRFFGLRSNPFGMTPDPGCLLLTLQHREAFAGLTYTILNRRGFGVLTGDAGTGKTTLVAKVLASLPRDKVHTSIIFHPTLSSSDFLELLMLDFGIPNVPSSKAQRLTQLHSFLLENHNQGKISTLIVDEAHKLGMRLLEEIRLLGNFDYTDQKLLQILLVGQTELDDLLTRQDMRQLKQRIAVRLQIKPIATSEVEAYIRYRWLKAGGSDPVPFSREAIEEIARVSRGLPRVINAVADNALLLAFAEEVRRVDIAHVRQGATDLQLIMTDGSVVEPTSDMKDDSGTPKAVPEWAPNLNNGTPAVSVEPPRNSEPAVRSDVPSPIRIPEFTANGRPSLLARWAGKLGIGNV
jgi:general secretion pathway protein A